MPALNTQPISDAHDKIFGTFMAGLDTSRDALVGISEKLAARNPRVPDLGRGVSTGFDVIKKGLNAQHDLVEGLLAKAR